jgi:hypothetical protein
VWVFNPAERTGDDALWLVHQNPLWRHMAM